MSRLSDSYHHVRFTIFNYIVARGYDIFQKCTCLCLWFEWPYFTNNNWYFVGFDECGPEASSRLEHIWTCTSLALLFALLNWWHWLPCHHMYCLSSSSSPSISARDQLNGETLAGKRAFRKVEQINWVQSFPIDKYNGRCNSIGHIEETRKSRNYNSKFAKKFHIQHLGLIYINTIGRENAPNWPLRTL